MIILISDSPRFILEVNVMIQSDFSVIVKGQTNKWVTNGPGRCTNKISQNSLKVRKLHVESFIVKKHKA